MKLHGKIAVITGGSRGIGFGCSKIFGKHGATVVIASNDQAGGAAAESDLASLGVAASFKQCDVTSEAAMHALFDEVASEHGRIDALVNNAGWHPPAVDIEDISVKDFEDLLRLNLTSSFMGCKFALPHLRKTRGAIVNISSEVALIGQAESVSYVASKAGQLGLTKALALDAARDGVRVNAVCPAGVDTPLMREWANTQYDPQAALRIVDSWHPLGRMATIEEIGEVCAFLLSDEASFITGQVICPDGGAALGYKR